MLCALPLLISSAAAFAPACQSESSMPAAHDPSHPHAQCLVCKSEGDLACVDVTIEPDTPRFDYRGVTYYFCSEQCRADFAKRPNAYLEAH